MTKVTAAALAQLAHFSAALIGINKRKREAESEYQTVRKQVFVQVNKLAGEGSKFTAELEETGYRIGRTLVHGSPSLDADKLREAIGDKLFKRVTTQTVTYSINYEALRDALREEEVTHSQIEKAIIPGRTTERLVHSKIGSAQDAKEQELEKAPPAKSDVEELLEF